MNDAQEYSITKTVIVSLLVAFLGILFFAYKVDACSTKPEACKEEFISMRNNSSPRCYPGAQSEIVTSPEPGMLCRCPHDLTPKAPPVK